MLHTLRSHNASGLIPSWTSNIDHCCRKLGWFGLALSSRRPEPPRSWDWLYLQGFSVVLRVLLIYLLDLFYVARPTTRAADFQPNWCPDDVCYVNDSLHRRQKACG